MSTMTYTSTTRRIGRAEWTKLRTLPSTWRTAVLTMVMALGFGVAVAFSEADQWHAMTAQQRQVFDPRRPCGHPAATRDLGPTACPARCAWRDTPTR